MTEGNEWIGRVGTSWSEEWRRTDRSFGELTARLLDETQIRDFEAALDIGCGAGEVSCALALAHPASQVLGLDISPTLIAVARRRGDGIANLHFAEGDAAQWVHERGHRPQLLISRHGVMFFADPPAAFAHLREQAAPEARLRFSCFRPLADNPWARALRSVVGGPAVPADPEAPGPFAFGDAARVERILGAAGWTDIGFEAVGYPMIASEEGANRETALDDAVSYFLRIGPSARAIAELSPDERAPAKARLRELLAGHYDGTRVTMPAAAWIVTATAS
jgi:SAM-dependent methyltransferase